MTVIKGISGKLIMKNFLMLRLMVVKIGMMKAYVMVTLMRVVAKRCS